MAFATQHGAAGLGLKRHLVVLAAVIADYLEFRRSILTCGCLLRSAFLASLRGGHVPLVKHFLILLGEQECLLALNAYCFYIGHVRFLNSLTRCVGIEGVREMIAQ